MRDRGSRDDYERIRLRGADRAWTESDLTGGGVPAFVGRVTTDSTAIGVGKFLMVDPLFVLGAEVEGGSGQLTSIGSPGVAVYLIGPAKASTGDTLVCRYVDNRWVSDRTSVGKGGGVVGVIPNCSCTSMPTSLTMTSQDPTCNYGMFQSCQIQYGPTPAVYSGFFLPSMTYMSTSMFPDVIAGGALFQYYLTCTYNQYNLSRLYPTSPFGGAYRDSILYSWVLGGYGNTCSPFHLDNGVGFPGSDQSCVVKIDG